MSEDFPLFSTSVTSEKPHHSIKMPNALLTYFEIVDSKASIRKVLGIFLPTDECMTKEGLQYIRLLSI